MHFASCTGSDNTYPDLGGGGTDTGTSGYGASGTYGTGTSGYPRRPHLGAGPGVYTGTSSYVTTADPRNSREAESRPAVPATLQWTRTEASRVPDPSSRWQASPGAKSLFAEALRVDRYPDMLSPATSIGDDGTVPVVAGGASTQRPWF